MVPKIYRKKFDGNKTESILVEYCDMNETNDRVHNKIMKNFQVKLVKKKTPANDCNYLNIDRHPTMLKKNVCGMSASS